MARRKGSTVLKNAIAYCRREMRCKVSRLREPYSDAIDIMVRLLLGLAPEERTR